VTERPKKVNKRCSKAEQEYRIRKLMTLVKNGWDTTQLRQYVREEYGLGDSAAHRLVDATYDAIVDGMNELDRRRINAITLVRFENAYRLAVSQRNPMAMVQANSHIANHWVKNAPEITSSAASADANDPEEDF
jgi:aspartokinase-like uncharacterized kinase